MRTVMQNGFSTGLSCLRIGVLIAAHIATTSVSADEAFRAGYEINLTADKDEWQLHTLADFSRSAPIVHHLGRYVVTIRLAESTASGFTLDVTVKHADKSAIQSVILKDTFAGSFGGILEFESKSETLSLSGAIALGRPRL